MPYSRKRAITALENMTDDLLEQVKARDKRILALNKQVKDLRDDVKKAVPEDDADAFTAEGLDGMERFIIGITHDTVNEGWIVTAFEPESHTIITEPVKDPTPGESKVTVRHVYKTSAYFTRTGEDLGEMLGTIVYEIEEHSDGKIAIPDEVRAVLIQLTST